MSETNDDLGYDEAEDQGSSLPASVPVKAKVAVRTPTEAKAEAVGSLLVKAVEKASDLRLTAEETAALKAEFPDEAFRPGAAGKENLLYIEHSHLRDRLDNVLGIGQAVLVPMNRWTEEGGRGVTVYVEAAFIVRGCYVTQSVGDMVYYPNNASQNYGDAVEGAETAALRRCAKKFGVGLQAWSKTWCEGWWARKGAQTPRNQHTPAADEQPHREAMPDCPKCGKNVSVIVGKPEYGGGFVCWKKKPNTPGCGHSWGGRDVRTGEEVAAAKTYESILGEWKKTLDAEPNVEALNTKIMTDYLKIPGKHPERAKVWTLIVSYAERQGISWCKGDNTFREMAFD